MIAALTNHLWQSTLFVLAAGLVAAALRRNGAHVRHRIWVVASLKFLVPFSVLMSLGTALPRFTPAAAASVAAEAPGLAIAVGQIAQPFSDDVFFPPAPAASRPATDWTTIVVGGIWACGFVMIALIRLRGWRRIRAAVRSSVPVDLEHLSRPRSADRTWVRGPADREPGPPYVRNGPVRARIPARSAPGLLEPGVVGFWRPVLLVPEGIERHLTSAQLNAVLAHELCHVERRDNLTSAIHMVVEAAFWFHPLVWFVGARMVDERERACDEHVLRVCGEPRVYAESILNVCKLYVESPLACVSGVGGSDLRKRVAAILVNRVGLQLSLARKVTLAIAAVLAIVLPLGAGMATAATSPSVGRTFSSLGGPEGPPYVPSAEQTTSPKWDAVSVKPCGDSAPPAGRMGGGAAQQASPGYLYLSCMTLRALVNLAYGGDALLNKPYGPGGTPGVPELVRGGPSWAYSEKFAIEAKADGVTDRDTLTTSTGQWALRDSTTRSMLRSLLEDRFQLKTHVATEEQSMYALTVAKTGLKIKRLAPGECWELVPGQPVPPHPDNLPMCDGFGGRWGSYEASGLTIGNLTPHAYRNLVDELFFMLRRMVIDRTGLDGRYSFALDFTPDDSTPGVLGSCGGDARCIAMLAASGVSDTRPETFKSGDTIFKALEKLGLKLDIVKAPAEYIVIDRAERPRPNTPAEDAVPPARALGAGSSASLGAGR